MPTRWKVYWIALGSLLFGASLALNIRRHRGQMRALHIAGKSVFEVVLACLMAWLCPPLLIAYCAMWLGSLVDLKPVWRVPLSVFSFMALNTMALRALEAVLIIGSWSMSMISESFMKNLKRAQTLSNK